MKKDQKGFSILELVLIIIAISLVSIIGYYVWYRHYHRGSTNPMPKPNYQSSATIPAGWLTYKSTNSQIQFSYPRNWQLKQDNPVNSNMLENITLSGSNNFKMGFELDKDYFSSALCQAINYGKPIPLNSQYEIVPNGNNIISTIELHKLNDNPKNFRICGTASTVGDTMFFTFNALYITPPTPDNPYGSFVSKPSSIFLNSPEVITAKAIFNTFKQ